jgi:hypothetical protein
MTHDVGAMYRASRLRITSLVEAVDAEDAATGNMGGVTTDAWTAAQVERGRPRSVGELIATWNRYSPVDEGTSLGET